MYCIYHMMFVCIMYIYHMYAVYIYPVYALSLPFFCGVNLLKSITNGF